MAFVDGSEAGALGPNKGEQVNTEWATTATTLCFERPAQNNAPDIPIRSPKTYFSLFSKQHWGVLGRELWLQIRGTTGVAPLRVLGIGGVDGAIMRLCQEQLSFSGGLCICFALTTKSRHLPSPMSNTHMPLPVTKWEHVATAVFFLSESIFPALPSKKCPQTASKRSPTCIFLFW